MTTVIPSEARNLALPAQCKLREESRVSFPQSEIPRFARNDNDHDCFSNTTSIREARLGNLERKESTRFSRGRAAIG